MDIIQNKERQPSINEIENYINNPLFSVFFNKMILLYDPKITVEYSGDTLQQGWNIKFRKAGKSLCVLYPLDGFFRLLIVVGRKEKARAEKMLPSFSEELQVLYNNTWEGNNQRWLMIDLYEDNDTFKNALELIRIRREKEKNEE